MKQVDPQKYSFDYYKNIYGRSVFLKEKKGFWQAMIADVGIIMF